MRGGHNDTGERSEAGRGNAERLLELVGESFTGGEYLGGLPVPYWTGRGEKEG